MARLILPSKLFQQPQGPARISPVSPYAFQLASIAAPGIRYDLVSGKPLTLIGTNISYVFTSNGPAWSGAATNCSVDIGASLGLQTILDNTKSWSWFGRINVTTLSTRQIFVADYDIGEINDSFGFEQSALNTWVAKTVNTSTAEIVVEGGTVTLGWHDVEVNVTYGINPVYTLDFYVDGVLIGSNTSMQVMRAGQGHLRLMNLGDFLGGLGFMGQMVLSAFWSHARGPAERVAIRNNPWQLFQEPIPSFADFSIEQPLEPPPPPTEDMAVPQPMPRAFFNHINRVRW